MEISIGVRDIAREITLEVEGEADEIVANVTDVLTKAAKGDTAAVLDLTDEKGNRTIVPAVALGYVQIGASEPRRVGFGTL